MAAENEFGRLDILVNNAGIFQAVKFEDLTEEQWDHMMNANLKSQFLCAQEAAPIMKRQGRGRIINLVSLGGARGRLTRTTAFRRQDASC